MRGYPNPHLLSWPPQHYWLRNESCCTRLRRFEQTLRIGVEARSLLLALPSWNRTLTKRLMSETPSDHLLGVRGATQGDGGLMRRSPTATSSSGRGDLLSG